MQPAGNSAGSLFHSLQQRPQAGALHAEKELLARYRSDGLTPAVVAFPQTAEEVACLLSTANEHRAPVLLWGGGTSMGLGNAPREVALAIDLTRLNRVLSHDIDNFTVTAQAGMRLNDLRKVLHAQRQFLTLDPPASDVATLGGIVAANASGPWRLAFGSARDLMLGLRIALPDGNLVSFGGKTMKNVAGYDVGKLFIGSIGTLGAICELTFRLYSLPEKSYALLISASDCAEAFRVAREAACWLPSALMALDPAAAGLLSDKLSIARTKGAWLLAVDLMGDESAVNKQANEIGKLASLAPAPLEGEERQFCWEAIRDLIGPAGGATLLCRANLPPSAVEEWSAAAEPTPGHLVACPGSGRAWKLLHAPTQPTATDAVNQLRGEALRLGGHLIVEAAPAEWKSQLDIWGAPPTHFSLLQQLKQTFDPVGILAPGRFVGGI